MQVNPYLTFNGQCEAAFKRYEQVLGSKIEGLFRYGESPMAADTPADWHNKVMHTSIRVGETRLMGSDAPPQHFEKPQGISVSINLDDPAEAERIFNGLAEGGQVTMPIQQTFWAARFGMLVDPWGIPWMINCVQ